MMNEKGFIFMTLIGIMAGIFIVVPPLLVPNKDKYISRVEWCESAPRTCERRKLRLKRKLKKYEYRIQVIRQSLRELEGIYR